MIVIGISVPNNASAIAYCALRDPVAAIHELYPDSTSFKSFVGTVGPEIREALRIELPFDFHFNEFGRHTLYTVFDSGAPVGLVHARSELGEWGLDEFVWGLDLDLRIHGLYLQRTRDPAASLLDTGEFRRQLIGLDLSELVAFLRPDGDLKSGVLTIEEPALKMARSVIHSAIKAIVVTQTAWAQDLEQIRALAIARQQIPNAVTVTRVDGVYTPTISDLLRQTYKIRDPALDREEAIAYEILDITGAAIGVVFIASIQFDSETSKFWWVIGADGIAQSLHSEEARSDDEIFQLFGDIRRSKEELLECATPGETAMLEIIVLADEQLRN